VRRKFVSGLEKFVNKTLLFIREKKVGRFTRNYWSPHVATAAVIQILLLETLAKRLIDDSNSPERSDSRDARTLLAVRNSPHFMEPEGSL
jgi:hypothetical protein